MSNRVRIVEKKLGRHKAWGLAWENRVEIDPRQDSNAYLDTLIHEVLHILFPHASERKIAKSANTLTAAVWSRGYRRIQK